MPVSDEVGRRQTEHQRAPVVVPHRIDPEDWILHVEDGGHLSFAHCAGHHDSPVRRHRAAWDVGGDLVGTLDRIEENVFPSIWHLSKSLQQGEPLDEGHHLRDARVLVGTHHVEDTVHHEE